MTEEELRTLVRDEVARQVAAMAAVPAPSVARVLRDPSHARFTLPAAEGGACIVEPHVMCSHCGYCKSYGH
jgi:hypothetical protein